MKKISYCFLFLLVFLLGCQDQLKVKKKSESNIPVVSEIEEPKTVKGKQIIWKKDKSIMVAIPPSNTIKPFWIDATEVTVGQFKKFLAESDHPFSGDLWKDIYQYSPTDSHPMINVDWHDATAYAEWAGKRLPTSNEWEFAARGGLINKVYPWGDDVSLARDYANYDGTGGKDKWDGIAPVGSFKPNGYGLYDMVGNVLEWCQDWYNSEQNIKVVRGGAWAFYGSFLPLVSDYGIFPVAGITLGFRCVLGSN